MLESTELLEEWQEEVKVAVKKTVPAAPVKTEDGKEAEPAPATTTEQEWETQTKRKTRSETISFDTQSFALPPQQRAQFKSLEEQLHIEDRKILDLKESKNKLETMCYNYRDNL